MGFCKTLCAALAVGLLLGSAPAEARFGKRSKPAAAKKDDDQDSSRNEHRASPGGRGSDAPVRARVSSGWSPWLEFLFVASPASYHRRVRVSDRGARAPAPAPLVHLNVQGAAFRDGGALDLFMALDGQRWGMDARVSGIGLDAEDGSGEVDRLTLLDAHVTVSPWSSERGRFRLEFGLASAHAPDAIFVGPSFAGSLEACLGSSPFDIEGRLQMVPFPHRQVDAQAGLAVHLGALNLRGGWRTLYLNDAGRLDGVTHVDTFSGPYAGLGLSF